MKLTKRIIAILLAISLMAGMVFLTALAKGNQSEEVNGGAPVPIPFLEKAVIDTAIGQLPYCSEIASTALTPAINEILGIQAVTTAELMEELKKIEAQIEELQARLDTSTQAILFELYSEKLFGDFDEFMNQVRWDVAEIYGDIENNVGKTLTTKDGTDISELYRTFLTACMVDFDTEDHNLTYPIFKDLVARVNGRYEMHDRNVEMLHDVFEAICFNCKLVGEASVLAAPYINKVCDVINSAYAAFMTVLSAKCYLCAHNTDIQTAVSGNDDFKLKWEKVADLYTKEDLDDYEKLYDDMYLEYSEIFGEGGIVEEYNAMIERQWFDYIRNPKVEAGAMQIEYVPLARTLKTLQSADDYAFGIDWNETERDVDDMLEYAVNYTHDKTGAAITPDELDGLLNQITNNVHNVFLPEETNDLGIKQYTLFDLLKNYGFEMPDIPKGLNAYVLHDARYYFNSTGTQQGATEYDANMEISGCKCSNDVLYRYNSDGTRSPEAENIKYNWLKCYKYEGSKYMSDHNNKWTRYPNEIYYYFVPQPVELNTQLDFEKFIGSIVAGKNYRSCYVHLNTDVDISGNYSLLWPEDKYDKEFCGTFDALKDSETGECYKISGLNDTTPNCGGGLFRTLGSGAEIKNLIIENPTVKGTGSNSGHGALAGRITGLVKISNVTVEGGSVTGYDRVGGLIGECNAQATEEITNCKNGAKVTATNGDAGGFIGYISGSTLKITDCQNTADVSGPNTAGGIAGQTYIIGEVTGCTNSGNITSQNGWAGGILAWSKYGPVDLSNAVNSGNITALYEAGGIAGWLGNDYDDQQITGNNCTNSGSVTGRQAGGIVGHLDTDSLSHEFSGCKNMGAITANDNAGGIIGASEGGGNFKNCSNTGRIIAKTGSAGGIIGWNEDNAIDFSNSVNGDENAPNDPVIGRVDAGLHAGGIGGDLRDEDADPVYTGTNCKNYGEITSSNDGAAGGIFGLLYTDAPCYLSYCVNKGNVSADQRSSGGLVGASWSNSVNALYASNYGKIRSNINDASQICGWNENGIWYFAYFGDYGSVDKASHVHNDSKITFKAWTRSNSLPTTAGNYYLICDVILTDTYAIPMNTSEINLCLNGHVIKQSTEGERCIRVGSRATLNIHDCNGDNCTHEGYVDRNGLWHLGSGSGTAKTITGGLITGSTNSGAYIYAYGHLNMYGGTIAGNEAKYGGGVYNDGVFNMYGGEICYNLTSTNSGGGVFSNSAYTNMYGGTISHNTAGYCGGGVHITNDKAFNMYGGTVSDNKAEYGGGICVYSGTLNMSNGTVSNNTAPYGGGVYARSGSVVLGGSSVIDNNTNNNLYVKNGFLIDFGTGENAPTEDMKIGVTLGSGTGAFTKSCSNYSAYFTSDNSAYRVAYNGTGKYLELKSADSVADHTTHKAVLQKGTAPKLFTAGCKDYYKCSCGKYYEDEACTVEIKDLNSWKAKGGNGYVAPTIGEKCDECGVWHTNGLLGDIFCWMVKLIKLVVDFVHNIFKITI